jgi:hypothetical protein
MKPQALRSPLLADGTTDDKNRPWTPPPPPTE